MRRRKRKLVSFGSPPLTGGEDDDDDDEVDEDDDDEAGEIVEAAVGVEVDDGGKADEDLVVVLVGVWLVEFEGGSISGARVSSVVAGLLVVTFPGFLVSVGSTRTT